MAKELAPIVLFVYNRPWHTQQTVEALQKNDLADQSELFIFADGPKIPSDSKVQAVRDYIKNINGFKKVTIIEREKNWGLADNIVDGVTSVVNQYGKIIVLEDDIVTSIGFLKYMNSALSLYENEEKVMHVSGYMFPINARMPNTFFYNTASCWGWGTWKRAWKYYNSNAKFLLLELYKRNLHGRFDLDGKYRFTNQLIDNVLQVKNTWAVKWYASFFIKNGFALHPYPSFTQNIGNDGSGVNSDDDVQNKYHWKKLRTDPRISKIPVDNDNLARSKMQNFYSEGKVDALKIKKWVSLFLPPFLIKIYQFIKKKSTVEVEKQRLQKLPRYYPGETCILKKKIKFLDSASFLFIYNELFEKEIYKFNTNTPEPYIIDAGANIGLCILYFKQLFPNAKIIAFEPDEDVFKVLKSNVGAFDLRDVQLVKKALWNEETNLKFFSEGSDAGRVSIDNPQDEVVDVETDLLSKYINRKVDLLKIDIEGAELNVLDECEDNLHLVEKIFVEYHSFTEKKQRLSRLLEILENAGFRIVINSPGISSERPFVNKSNYMGMDYQLNIYGYRK